MTTIEEKARRYDEALERAKNTIEVNQTIPDIVECVESLFPELAENKDEKIRKDIISYLALYKDAIGEEYESWIAWLEMQGELVNSLSKGLDNAHERIDELIQKNNLLIEQLEKQGEQNVNRETKPRTYGDFIKRLTESEQEYLQGYVNKVIEKTKELQKQGEQNPIKEHNVCDFCEDRYGCVNPCPVKLIEQKSTDKVKPKFKVGDWVVDKNGTARQILSYKDGIYKHTDGYSATIFEDEWRMWDIAKDAKDGDVIYSRHNTESFEWIGIFRSLDKENKRVFFYGFWNSIVKSFCVCEDEAYVLYDDFSPATKEQRDALMKAMIDAGYTFDFEKKELKKIEQESTDKCMEWYDFIRWFVKQRTNDYTLIPSDDDIHKWGDNILNHAKKFLDKQNVAWNEEDEKMLDDILMCGEHHCYLDAENIGWLKSLKERMQPQPKQEWSEEDERIFKVIHNSIDLECLSKNGLDYEEMLNWFQSIKCRITPQQKQKPWSEEDEKMFVNIKSALQNANKDYSREIGWFHLLRLQKQWRPSEKQINALSDVLSLRDIKYDVLSELLECLKKRREEQL